MSHICPQCSLVNPDSTAFCTRCGYQFQGNETPVDGEPTSRQVDLPAEDDPSVTLNKQQPVPAAVVTPQAQPPTLPATPAFIPNPSQPLPATPAFPSNPSQSLPPQVAPNAGQPQFSYGAQPAPQGFYPPQQQQQVYGQQPYGMQPVAQPASGDGLVSLQRAFVGKGTPVHHQSWLLDNKQAQPATLRATFIENIQKQGVLGLTASPDRLREQGVVQETRDYVKVQYGISSVLVYFAPMGQNLYISRTSAVQQSYSRIRVVLLITLLFFLLLSLLLFAVINPTIADFSDLYSFSGTAKLFFGCAFLGLLFFFLYALIRSIVSWLTENDFLAFLRPNRLNDFTLDALSSIEQITDKAIRETVKQAGLNAADVTVPAQGYGLSQPLHRI